MKYEPFSELIKPYCEGACNAMPETLRQRSVDVYSLWGAWDDLTPEVRRSVAEQHDLQFDPKWKDRRNLIWQLTPEIDQCLQATAWWEKMPPKSITEAGKKEAKLATLALELAALQQRLIAPFSGLPATKTEPDQSTPGTATAPPSSVASRKPRPKKPTIEAVALDYMREMYRAGQFESAAKFHKHLKNKTEESNSPFEMGTGENARKLFCPAASSFFDVGTLGKIWAKIRAV
jgi:hypothetical protein